jgi:hypothetical protein
MEKFANNAAGVLSAGISNSDVSLVLNTGQGSRWPTLGVGDWCWTTITDGTTIEIVRVTARSGDTLTIVRGRQGTTGTSFSAGAAVQMRLTRQTLEDHRDGSKRLVLATGFSASNYLDAINDSMQGHADVTIAIGVRLGLVEDPDATGVTVAGAGANQFSDGWKLQYSTSRPGVGIADGTGTMIATNGSGADWSGLSSSGMINMVDFKTIILMLRYEGGSTEDLDCILNGIVWRTLNTSGGVSAGTSGNPYRARLGGGEAAGQYATDAGIFGFAYADQAFTRPQARAWMRACMEEADIVSGGLGWDTLVSFKQLGLRAGDSVPSTVDDLAGSNDFTLTGALSIVEETPRWL